MTRNLVILTAALFAGSMAAYAQQDFEIVTSKAVYVTEDGVAPNARPAFEVKYDSFEQMMADPKAQILAHELATGTGETIMRPLRIGERPFEIQSSRAERESILKKITPDLAGTTAIFALPLLIADPPLLIVGIGAAIAAKSTVPLEEVINTQDAREPTAGRGRYGLVLKDGRVIPSAGRLVERMPNGGLKDSASYVVRHVRQPNSPPILTAWVAKVATGLFIRFRFNFGPGIANSLKRAALGKFASTTADLLVRSTGSSSSSSGGSSSCGSFAHIPGMPYMPSLPCASLTPSLPQVSPAPTVDTRLTEIRVAAPEVAVWVSGGATVRAIPVAPQVVTLIPEYRGSVSTLPPGGGNSNGNSGGDNGGSSGREREHNMKGLPKSVELTGGFGGFKINR